MKRTVIRIISLAVLVALLFTSFPTIIQARPTGTADFSLIPSKTSINVGDYFTVDIMLDASTQTVDSFEAFVLYNTSYIKAVTATHVDIPATANDKIVLGTLTQPTTDELGNPTGYLTYKVKNIINNTTGRATLAFMVDTTADPPDPRPATTYGSLGTITFKALQAISSIDLTFDVSPSYTTTAALSGVDVTRNTTGTSITISQVTKAITASTGDHGIINPSGTVNVNSGANQTFNITPDTGYHVADVLVDGSSVGAQTSYTFTNVTATHTIAASFAINTFAVNASVTGGNGSAVADPTPVNYGGSSTVTLTPTTGYHLATLTDNTADVLSQVTGNTYTISNVTAIHNVIATYAINTYNINASAPGGHGSATADPTTVNYGGSSTITFSPSSTYHLSALTDNDTNVFSQVSNGSYALTNVTANHTIVAVFAIDTWAITASAGDHGSISPAGTVNVNHGADQAFTITPDDGYHVADVVIDSVSQGAQTSYTFTNVTATHTISATFAINTFAVNASVSGQHGSVDPATQTVNYGSNASIAITPDAGYHISSITDNAVSVTVANPYVIDNVKAIHNVVVTFAIDTFIITPSAGTGGSISPSTPQTVDYGATPTFTIVADTGYHIVSVKVDGNNVTLTDGAYTFPAVSANHAIAATFALDTFTVTFNLGAHGARTGGGVLVQTVNWGEAAEAPTFTVENGWAFTGWDQTFTSVKSNLTVNAQYSEGEYTLTIETVGGGTVAKSPDQSTYHYGDVVTLTPTSYKGWTFNKFSDNVTNDQVTINGNTTVTATFTQNEYTLTLIVTGNGTVNKSPDKITYHYMDSIILTTAPGTGWALGAWSSNDIDFMMPRNYPMQYFYMPDKNITVTAAFNVGLTIPVTLQGRENGTVNPVPVDVWLFTPGASWTTASDHGALYHYPGPQSNPILLTTTSNTTAILLYVPPGAYDVRVKDPTSLRAKIAGVDVSTGPVTTGMVTLVEGDTNGDNQISALDYSKFIYTVYSYGEAHGYPIVVTQSLPGTALCDFNWDGQISALDYSLLVSNYGQNGGEQ